MDLSSQATVNATEKQATDERTNGRGQGGGREENATGKIIVNCDSRICRPDSIATGLTIINVRANASVFTDRERKRDVVT